MKIIRTHETSPTSLSEWERDQVYNGLDCCVTREVFDVIHPGLDNHTAATYAFSKDLQGPALEMRLRGVLVDTARRAEVIDEMHDRLDKLERNLDLIVLDGVGAVKFNWRSNEDLKEIFYGKLGIPEIKSKGRVSVDVNALGKLEQYLIARPIVYHITAMRELGKRIGVLRTPLDTDGRMRTSYNIAGTNTGRFSSSGSEFGTGGNLQNVEESLRSIFIPDPGMKFAKFDAKSGESFVVGAIEWNLFNDPTYLEACESGDPHTAVARICWPGLGWTGNLRLDKEIAERPYYRHYSYRFMCKKLGHGSNYGGQPFTLAQQSHLPIGVVQQFQPKYFDAFPAHRRWQDWVADQLLRYGYLVNLTGRKRWFMGRRNDAATLREAIAYDPQGSLADIVNRAMLRIWHARDAALMMHDHDALTIQYPEEREDEIIPKIMAILTETIELDRGRTLRISYDCKVGWNKGDYDKDHPERNPQGLKDYVPNDKRKREARPHLLDRPLHRVN
jgi:DNA polymerase-1